MEKIIYGIIIGIGAIVSYLFGRRSTSNGRTTLDGINKSIDRTIEGLDESTGDSERIVGEIESAEARLNDSAGRLNDSEKLSEESTTGLNRIQARNDYIEDIVRELHKRSSERESGDDTDK